MSFEAILSEAKCNPHTSEHWGMQQGLAYLVPKGLALCAAKLSLVCASHSISAVSNFWNILFSDVGGL